MQLSRLFFCTSLLVQHATAIPTWPAATDEIEDLMVQLWGYRRKAFADGVSPCSFSAAGPGRIAAAEWIRTAFHDMATANIYLGTGGMDASIMFETNRSENIGAAFTTTLTNMLPFYNSRAGMADLLALSVYAAVRSCGGPVVPVRGGRKDATVGGSIGVPEPQNDIGTFQNQFARSGFSTADMIAMTACGHTVGGVHASNFPAILKAGTAANDYQAMDTSVAVFDNKIAVEYISGNSTDPMLVGQSVANGQASDLKVFSADGNVTMRTLTDPAVFKSTCASILQRMIEVVPKSVTLTDVIQTYDVKPQLLQLTLNSSSAIKFTGEIRVRTTVRPNSQISSVQLQYKDRNGGSSCGGCIINAQSQGLGSGFDDTFWFYSFSAIIPADTSISTFNIVILTTSGTTEMYNNNGAGFPIQDSVMFQSPQSCLSNGGMTVTAAVRSALSSTGSLDITLQNSRTGVVVPVLVNSSVAMTKQSTVGPYSIYSATYALASAQNTVARFDVSTGTGSARLSDSFKAISSLGSTCGTLSGIVSSNASSINSSSLTSPTFSFGTSSTSTSTSAIPTCTGWCSQGCYTDSTSNRSLAVNVGVGAALTNENCQTTCLSMGYIYAGTEYSRECWCGTGLQNDGIPAPDGKAGCNMPCIGDSTQICGGSNRLTIYKFVVVLPPPSSSTVPSSSQSSSFLSLSSSSSLSASPSTTSLAIPPPGWTSLGCYTDSTAARALGNNLAVAGGPLAMSHEACAEACLSSQYTYSGTEYSGECWCDNSIANSQGPASDGQINCNMACNGNVNQICGGPNRLTLFSYGEVAQVARGSSITSGSSSSSSTSFAFQTSAISTESSSSSPSSTNPRSSTSSSESSSTSIFATTSSSTLITSSTSTSTAGTSLPTIASYYYLSCMIDSQGSRTLNDLAADSDKLTLHACAAFCSGYIYFGVEYGRECYCSNTLSSSGFTASDSDCSMVCSGSSASASNPEICGARNRLSVYKLQAGAPVLLVGTAPAVLKQSVDSWQNRWNYSSCMTEATSGRALSASSAISDNMTLEMCAGWCAGYSYFGAEYGRECYCGDEFEAGSVLATNGDSECSFSCTGDQGELCGAGNRLSAFARI